MAGQKRFGYFRLGRHSGFSKVTRCKSETASGRYRRNGYVPNPRQPLPQQRICPQSQAAVTAATDMYTCESQAGGLAYAPFLQLQLIRLDPECQGNFLSRGPARFIHCLLLRKGRL
jgi:hypothetical protein